MGNISKDNAQKMLVDLRNEIADINGAVKTDDFASLRSVDQKIQDFHLIVEACEEIPRPVRQSSLDDVNYTVQSRRVRLETLLGHVDRAISYLKKGFFQQVDLVIENASDFSKVCGSNTYLPKILERRWKEAQLCRQAGAFLSSVIMMGSILEGVLLAKCQDQISQASTSSRAPRNKDGSHKAIHDWNLSQLIDVSTERGWLKADRSKFSSALRESRNIVHPWAEVSQPSNFDANTCAICWEALKASIIDLRGK